MGVLEMFDGWRRTGWPDYGDEVEAAGTMVRRPSGQEVPGGVFDAPPLAGVDGFLRVLGVGVRAGFDLDEDDHVGVGADQIDLAGGAAVVARQDAPTTPFEKARGRTLTPTPEGVPVVRRTRTRAQPSEPPSYEREVHGPFVPCRCGHADSRAWRGEPCHAV